jgi:nitrite reductase (NO-forming)
MFGVIIIDPKDAGALPKADREYVLIQSELYKNAEDKDTIMAGKWDNVVFNMGVLKYDPVHDPQGTKMLFAKPGERVRVFFVNAGPHEFSAFHPIAGIWDRVYPSGNPKNTMYGLQTYTVGPGDAAIFDVISPVEGANAIVTHSLKQAMSGAIAVLMFNKEFPKDVDPNMGNGANILVR